MNAHNFRSMFRRRNLVPLTFTFLLLLVVVCGFSHSRAQSDEKGEREVVEKIPKHLPIKVKVKKPEKLKDAENEDWLGELEVEVTNTGTKPIYHLDISVFMPDVFAPNGRNMGYVFAYGRRELVALDEPVRPDDVPIQPGGVVVLKVPAGDAEGWKKVRGKGEVTNPKKLVFIFNGLNFGDGTGFIGSDGRPLPEPRELGSKAPCPGGGSHAGEVTPVAHQPRSYFPDIASLTTYLPPPANLVPAFLGAKSAAPVPAARQDICCSSQNGCSRLKRDTDQGCPCPGVIRDIVEPASCSDPAGTCSTIRYESKTCTAWGVTFYCEHSFPDTTCNAQTPTPTPTPVRTPAEPQPHHCCTPEVYIPDPNLSAQICRWNCRAGETSCAGERLADGCFVLTEPVVCEALYGEGYRYTTRSDNSPACCPVTPTPTPLPTQPLCGSCPAVPQHEGHISTAWCDIDASDCFDCIDNDCDGMIDSADPNCTCMSPVLIDTLGDGFDLTDGPGGVGFDIDGDGIRNGLSWTAAGADDAWLALDRNGNGAIDDGRELFGNFTAQPDPPPGALRNGFLALAEFDRAGRGGNADGLIDGRDAVFSSLRLWRDANHDGVSQGGELHALPALHVEAISLDYREVRRRDRHGNGFRYQATVNGTEKRVGRRLAFDVFLIPGRPAEAARGAASAPARRPGREDSKAVSRP